MITLKSGLAVGMIFLSAFGAQATVNGPARQQVEIRTSVGDIVVELDPVAAPRTCRAFLSYVQQQVYHGSGFYTAGEADIQGGRPGPAAVGFSSSGNFFRDAPAGEFTLKHLRGAVGLARTVGDCNRTKSSNSTQFYIVRKTFPGDDGEYSVFGHVVRGMDVVDRIAALLARDPKTPISFDVVTREDRPDDRVPTTAATL